MLFTKYGEPKRIGHKGFVLLCYLYKKASEENYPEILELYGKELIYYADLKSYSDLVATRDILINNKYIKKYEKTNPGTNQPGRYHLNYEKIR